MERESVKLKSKGEKNDVSEIEGIDFGIIGRDIVVRAPGDLFTVGVQRHS